MFNIAKIARAAVFAALAMAAAGCAGSEAPNAEGPVAVQRVAYTSVAQQNQDRRDAQERQVITLTAPIQDARVSSHFGLRTHPVTGARGSMHKGLDLAAPTGTPVMAIADGVVAFKGEQRGYGNILEIQHNAQMESAYAHLDDFAPTVREGQAVRRGQVIGYVGSTGRATGPHLHLEIRMNGEKIDPLAFQSMRVAFGANPNAQRG